MTRIRCARAMMLGLVAASSLVLSLAAPAMALTALGTIRITVEGSDPSVPLDGWEYAVSSENCAVPEGAVAVSDETGVASFLDLAVYAAEAEQTECSYVVVQSAREGYEQVTAQAELEGLTAGTPETEPATGVALTEAVGEFVNPTRNPEPNGSTLAISCLEGAGTAEIRAGRNPLTRECDLPSERKSGLRFAAVLTPDGEQLPPGEVVLAELAHLNQTIQRGLHNADLALSLTFTDLATGETPVVDATYTVRIDETEDLVFSASSCEYQGSDVPNRAFACADRVTLTQPDEAVVGLGTARVDVRLSFGAMGADGTCGAPTNEVFTAERADTAFCLLAVVEPVAQVEPTVVTVVNRSLDPAPTEEPRTDVSDPTESPTSTDDPARSPMPAETATGEPTHELIQTTTSGRTTDPSEGATSELARTGSSDAVGLALGALSALGGGAAVLAATRRRTLR
ncbi:hypothetical protein [Ruania alba]|uniref:Gram-positive cocci surface proteins LPxTG domain-containing protein n=1 Tax=Ruania alba TaxID=648782 RepID=A0A1H5MAI7_9MICO|nr:hypothetical protein [Ruania alba]SEE86275.1 hypothetical protein SAMN04488554_3250 [Ruania alba]